MAKIKDKTITVGNIKIQELPPQVAAPHIKGLRACFQFAICDYAARGHKAM